jgi:hypothetical protein
MWKLLASLLLGAGLLAAHVGVRDVYFEGLAGPYPLSVVIRPPSVIPGVAEVGIRAGSRDVRSIEITPMTLTGVGSKYPPTPDRARVNPADAQYFTGASWLMVSGSWQVRIRVAGDRGVGEVSVPVRAASERVASMDPLMAVVLAGLVGLLVLGAVGIAGAAISEARQLPGAPPRPARQIWMGRAFALGIALAAVAGALQWWEREAQAYSDSIYRPLAMAVKQEGDLLHVQVQHSGWYQNKDLDDFIEDHGHRMHLFLVAEPDASAMWHLHPQSYAPGKFTFHLPKLQAGRYRLFADVLHRNGFPETLTTTAELQEGSGQADAPSDDAGLIVGQAATRERPFLLPNGWQVRMQSATVLVPGEPTKLSFEVVDADGNLVKNLKDYLGMPGHLVVLKKDLTVFAHLHPAGTASMSAIEMARSGLEAANLPTAHAQEWRGAGELGFPFGFPSAGEYRIFLQFRDSTQVFTAPFDFSIR